MRANPQKISVGSHSRCAVQVSATDTCATPELKIEFGKGQVHISAEQITRIKAWRFEWPMAVDKVDVLLRGARRTARAGRLRRLHSLVTLLEQLGISAKRVFPEVEWANPTRMGSMDDMPKDTIWLKICPHVRHRILV